MLQYISVKVWRKNAYILSHTCLRIIKIFTSCQFCLSKMFLLLIYEWRCQVLFTLGLKFFFLSLAEFHIEFLDKQYIYITIIINIHSKILNRMVFNITYVSYYSSCCACGIL